MVFNVVDYGKLQLLQNIVKHLLGTPLAPYRSAPASTPVAATGFRASTERLRDVAGDYVTRAGLMRITVRGDTLAARWEGSDLVLEPASDSSLSCAAFREMESQPVTIKRCGTTCIRWKVMPAP
jgi:hypothetical protein